MAQDKTKNEKTLKADSNLSKVQESAVLEKSSATEKTEMIRGERLIQVEKAEVEKLRKENSTLENNLRGVSGQLNELRKVYETLKKNQSTDADSLQQQVAQLMEDNAALQKENELQKKRLSTSFTSQELANYLNDAIADFNSKIGQASDTVSYTIGNMDVNLKAQIVKQNDKLGFITSSDTGETALSEIRFTIAATPRT